MRLRLIHSYALASILCAYSYIYSHANRFVSDYITYAQETLQPEHGAIHKVLFVPHDNVKSTLLGLIYNEQKNIHVSMFRLTDKEVVQALLNAHERGIVIKIIVDGGCFFDKNEKITTLKSHGISVRVYNKPYSYMHNKIWIFGKNFNKKSLLWTGSANATYSGLSRNEENVCITDKREFIVQHKEKFEELWQKLAQEGEY